MVNQQLLDYIKQQLNSGVSQEQIKNLLITNGWKESDINEVFIALSNPVLQSGISAPLSSIQVQQQNISSLPSAIAILKQAWSTYQKRIGTFLGISAIPILVSVGLLVILAGGSFALLRDSSLVSSVFRGEIILPLAVLLLVIIVIINIWSNVALLFAIKDSKENIGVIEAYSRGWRKIFSYLWIVFLVGLITTGGFLLFIIPGIIFTVWFSLAVFIFMVEDLKGMNALLKSKEYVRGKWGAVFWRLFFIGFLWFIVLVIPGVLFAQVPAAEAISNLLVGFLFTPLMTTYLFLVYSYLKAVKGEVVFMSTTGQKSKFIIIAILGILMIPVIIFAIIFFSNRGMPPQIEPKTLTPGSLIQKGTNDTSIPTEQKIANPESNIFSIPDSMQSAQERERDSKRIAGIKQLQMALEIYFSNKNDYPPAVIIDDGDPNNIPLKLSTGNGFSTVASGMTILEHVQENPLPNGTPYIYTRLSPTDFTINFTLEKGIGVYQAGHHVATPYSIK